MPWTLAEFEDALAKLRARPASNYALDVKLNYGRANGLPTARPGRSRWAATRSTARPGRRPGHHERPACRGRARLTLLQGFVKKRYAPAAAGDGQLFRQEDLRHFPTSGHWMWVAHRLAFGDTRSGVAADAPGFGAKAVLPETAAGHWAINGEAGTRKPPESLLESMLSTDNAPWQPAAMGGVRA